MYIDGTLPLLGLVLGGDIGLELGGHTGDELLGSLDTSRRSRHHVIAGSNLGAAEFSLTTFERLVFNLEAGNIWRRSYGRTLGASNIVGEKLPENTSRLPLQINSVIYWLSFNSKISKHKGAKKRCKCLP